MMVIIRLEYLAVCLWYCDIFQDMVEIVTRTIKHSPYSLGPLPNTRLTTVLIASIDPGHTHSW